MHTRMSAERPTRSRRDFLRVAAGAAIGTLVGGSLRAERALAATSRPAPRVAPPLPERPFNMLVFGDSIMWGQGLDDGSKFSYLVETWLEQRLGRPVRREVFAHSGAQIGEDAKEDAKPPLHPEVPNGFPSIPAEIRAANEWLAHPTSADPGHLEPVPPEAVSLVLLDGGINDVDVRDILTVDPTI